MALSRAVSTDRLDRQAFSRSGRTAMNRIGLIVNPLAGIGGRVGLKGSDGTETQRRALELGAIPFIARPLA
jgi:hypothetical protein